MTCITLKEVVIPLWLLEFLHTLGTAIAELIPGIISNFISLCCKYKASSLHDQKQKDHHLLILLHFHILMLLDKLIRLFHLEVKYVFYLLFQHRLNHNLFTISKISLLPIYHRLKHQHFELLLRLFKVRSSISPGPAPVK